MKQTQNTIEFLTEKEFHKLFESIPSNTIQDIRDRAIIQMIASTGMRISELIALNIPDFLGKEEIIIQGK